MCQNDSPMSQYLDFAPQAVLVCRIWSGHAKVSDRWDRRRALSLGVSNWLIEIGSNRLIGPKMAIDLKPVP